MTAPKHPQLIDVDISTLETIYADGRAMGRLLQDFKDDLAGALLKIATLESELRTAGFKLKCVTDLYEKAIAGQKNPKTPRGLPRHIRGTKRNTAKLRNAAH